MGSDQAKQLRMPPKEVWLRLDDFERRHLTVHWLEADDADKADHAHYRLVPTPRPAIAFVIREGTKKGRGRYWHEPIEDFVDELSLATRYSSEQMAGDTRANTPYFDETRTVKLVKKKGGPR